jgi:hypothetical protein
MEPSEQYEEWKALPLSEKMRADIAMASYYADDVAQLEAENRILRANVSKSVLRRLDIQLAEEEE